MALDRPDGEDSGEINPLHEPGSLELGDDNPDAFQRQSTTPGTPVDAMELRHRTITGTDTYCAVPDHAVDGSRSQQVTGGFSPATELPLGPPPLDPSEDPSLSGMVVPNFPDPNVAAGTLSDRMMAAHQELTGGISYDNAPHLVNFGADVELYEASFLGPDFDHVSDPIEAGVTDSSETLVAEVFSDNSESGDNNDLSPSSASGSLVGLMTKPRRKFGIGSLARGFADKVWGRRPRSVQLLSVLMGAAVAYTYAHAIDTLNEEDGSWDGVHEHYARLIGQVAERFGATPLDDQIRFDLADYVHEQEVAAAAFEARATTAAEHLSEDASLEVRRRSQLVALQVFVAQAEDDAVDLAQVASFHVNQTATGISENVGIQNSATFYADGVDRTAQGIAKESSLD